MLWAQKNSPERRATKHVLYTIPPGTTLVNRFINDSEAFRREERDKINKKRIAMAKYAPVQENDSADGRPST